MRLGPHVMLPLTTGSRPRQLYEEWITKTQPPVVKFCRQGLDPAVLAWTRAQGSKVVARYVDVALVSSGAENARLARKVLGELLPFAAHIDYVEFGNEEMQGKDDPRQWDKLMEACLEFMRQLVAANRAAGRQGPRACIANVSVGQPELERWTRPAALEAARFAAENGAVWGIHEYYKPDPWAMVEGGKAAWDGAAPAEGWLMLRCAKVAKIMRGAGVPFQFIITESGRDNVPGQPGPGGGFRDVPSEPFAERMAEYGRHLSALPECVGWVDFGYNAWQGWEQFDLTRDEAMHDRMIAAMMTLPRQPGEQPAPVPIPPAPQPPEVPAVPPIIPHASEHHSSRGGARVSWVILHSTASPAGSTPIGTRDYLTSNAAQVSVHELVNPEATYIMVHDDRAAHHAGYGTLPDAAGQPGGTNARSWGLEIYQVAGQACAPALVERAAERCAAACRRFGLGADRVLAHREIDPSRRSDPVGVNMTTFRQRVAEILRSGSGAPGMDRQALVAAARAAQRIQLNPAAALQRALAADGFVPTSGEFDHADASGQYVGQRAEQLATGAVRVYVVPVGRWSEVSWVEG